MRDLSRVIEALLPIIPDEYEALSAELHEIMDEIRYQPPEMMREWWIALAHAFHHHIGKEAPTEGWKLRCHNIIADIEKIPGAEA